MTPQQLSYTQSDRLYLNITDRCTLDCIFCPKNRGIWMAGEYDLILDHRPSVEEILDSFSHPEDYREVVFCGYGEPTLRLNVLIAVAREIKQRGGMVRVDTDGLANLVHKYDVLPELASCVDVISVSMHAQDAATYDRICLPGLPGSYEKMLEFITLAPRYIKDVWATAIEGIEGVDIDACRKIAEGLGVTFIPRTLDCIL